LLDPKKPHEISDDLESAFFVLMYYALHYVKHNKKEEDIDMQDLFDQDTTKALGGQQYAVGGKGKLDMYSRDEGVADLKFLSKPLTDLFWDLHYLFNTFVGFNTIPMRNRERLATQDHCDSVVKLSNCDEVLRLFKKALDRTDWPARDKASTDQFPLTGPKVVPFKPRDPREIAASGSSSYTAYLRSANGTASTGSKRGSEFMDEPDGPPSLLPGADIEQVRKKVRKLTENANRTK